MRGLKAPKIGAKLPLEELVKFWNDGLVPPGGVAKLESAGYVHRLPVKPFWNVTPKGVAAGLKDWRAT